jgi:uncharacterized membrane protein
MLKFLLKIWPSFLPIFIYILWVLIIENILIKKILRRQDYIEGEKIIGEKSTKKSHFSLQNRNFLITLYASFLIAIFTLISFAFN